MKKFVDSTATDLETKKVASVENSDHCLFLPCTTRKLEDDYIKEATRPGMEDEVAGYTPTRRELIQLLKYCYRERLTWRWDFFITGNSEIELQDEASWHMRRIAAALVEKEVVAHAIEEAHDECKRKFGNLRLWDIYENADSAEWVSVSEEHEEKEPPLERLEQLEKKFRGDFIAMVLCRDLEDKSRVVLLSPADSKLNAVLQATGKCEVVTDRSAFKSWMRNFTARGFIRAARVNGRWAFEILDIHPGSSDWNVLKAVISQIKELLLATREKSNSAEGALGSD